MGNPRLDRQYVVGIDVGGTDIKAAISNGSGVLHRAKWAISKQENVLAIPNQIHTLIEHICGKVVLPSGRVGIDQADLLGVGIGSPGPFLDGEVHAENLAIKGIPILNRLTEWGYQNVVLENDLGAKVWGMGKLELVKGMQQLDIGVLNPGTGYGTDAIVKFRDIKTGDVRYGKILGKNGNGMEAGHIPVAEGTNSRCKCGNFGDLEIMASGSGMETRYFEKSGERISCKEIFERYGKDNSANEVIEGSLRATSVAIATLTNVLDTETWYIIGNPVKDYTDSMMEHLNDLVHKFNPQVMQKGMKIIVANKGSPYEKLEEYSSAVGSTSLVMPEEWVPIWNEKRPWENMPEQKKIS